MSALLLPLVAVITIIGGGIVSNSRLQPVARPAGTGQASPEVFQGEWQNVPARLWQDPFEATASVIQGIPAALALSEREAQAAIPPASETSAEPKPLEAKKPAAPPESPANFTTLDKVIWFQTHDDFGANPEAPDYTRPHKVRFLFVSMPSASYPETGEQRIRTRVAVVSALTTAGYAPTKATRLGVAAWKLGNGKITTQLAYPFEIFSFDPRMPTLESDEHSFSAKVDSVVVFYVADDAIRAESQLDWVRAMSELIATHAPRERIVGRGWISARWIGPLNSDRLVSLLQTAAGELAVPPTRVFPKPGEYIPIEVLAIRPTIDPRQAAALVRENRLDEKTKPNRPAASAGAGMPSMQPERIFTHELEHASQEFHLSQTGDPGPRIRPWITLHRLGCDDGRLALALVKEIKLRRRGLLDGPKLETERQGPKPTVVILSEWDTLYGRVLPKTFRKAFTDAGGSVEELREFSYLHGLDGQISATSERVPVPTANTAQNATPEELMHRLLASHAPAMAYGRTQVDYVARFADQLKRLEEADGGRRIDAIGVLGSDIYDKLLILRELKKFFPGALYFTTELDAALCAPDEFDTTRNLLVASGFHLSLRREYQRGILPFRDSGQTAQYFATLEAVEFFTVQKNRKKLTQPLRDWTPAVFEVGRNGPQLLGNAESIRREMRGDLHGASPFPELSMPKLCETWRWTLPLLAVFIIFALGLTAYGRLAFLAICHRAHTASYRLLHVRHWRIAGWLRLIKLAYLDVATWTLLAGTFFFVVVSARIPQIAMRENEEPFFLTEGISSWPTTWLRGLAVFLGVAYFWCIQRDFRRALREAQRDLAETDPRFTECARPGAPGCGDASDPRRVWWKFLNNSRRVSTKAVIVLCWLGWMAVATFLFLHLPPPSETMRGTASVQLEKIALMASVFSMNLLIVYAVVHNVRCAKFIDQLTDWLRAPHGDLAAADRTQATLVRLAGRIGGVMAQMVYYPFTLLFLLFAARHPLFDNFDWPVALLIVFAVNTIALLLAAWAVRRNADRARTEAVENLECKAAQLRWKLATETAPDEETAVRRGSLARVEWHLAQIQKLGGAALSEGIFCNPLLRALLIPIGGTGILQGIDFLSKL